jgi:hypothetical protein
MWRGFGTGLEGRGVQLNSAIHVGPGSGANFDQGAYAILARPGAAQAFLPDQNSGWSALNATGNSLIDTMSPAATTAQAFIDQRAATQAFISKFPAAEANIDAGFAPGVGPQFWGSVGNLSDTLKPVLPELPNALRAATAFLRNTQTPLRNTIPALNEVPKAVPPTLRILTALRPDLGPVRQALTNLVPPVTSLSYHGCDIQSFATGTLGLTGLGTTPGGTWGPDVGFPLSVIMQPAGYLNPYVNTHQNPYLDTSGYSQPCKFTPGPVINGSTFQGVLSSLLNGALPR